LKHPHRFKHLRHAAPHQILQKQEWQKSSGTLHWRLFEGDFLQRLQDAEKPDVIFYDPFSSKVDAPLWTKEAFKILFRATEGKPSMLMTYSVSTLVRALLISEGFYVGSGAATGPKSETTVAFNSIPDEAHRSSLLGAEWLSRWERSGAKAPPGMHGDDLVLFEERVRNSPQFKRFI